MQAFTTRSSFIVSGSSVLFVLTFTMGMACEMRPVLGLPGVGANMYPILFDELLPHEMSSYCTGYEGLTSSETSLPFPGRRIPRYSPLLLSFKLACKGASGLKGGFDLSSSVSDAPLMNTSSSPLSPTMTSSSGKCQSTLCSGSSVIAHPERFTLSPLLGYCGLHSGVPMFSSVHPLGTYSTCSSTQSAALSLSSNMVSPFFAINSFIERRVSLSLFATQEMAEKAKRSRDVHMKYVKQERIPL
mmetsp:Transcript_14347/g.36294  ORF Transcript_14347/g.36294 Transcript_14347/m.36294 type:complete len:244 (-) Transcript_14347:352-1083(-)